MTKTAVQYKEAIAKCKTLFLKKTKDYGTAWRILRPISLTDQIFIKAKRIRTIEVKGEQKIAEGRESEFIGIINYCIMSLIQLDLDETDELYLSYEIAEKLYSEKVTEVFNLMLAKNHDYGEAWRSMRISSFTDLILMKLLRIKQIEDNAGTTLVSEGVGAGYSDIMNYAIFGLIKLEENKNL
ncbi:MAG: DUF1599 domain-containing protein [Chitinophagales bacterium]